MNDFERDELFSRARRAASPTDDDRRRVRSALARQLGVAAGASAAAAVVKAAASQAQAIPAAATAAPSAVTGVAGANVAASLTGLGLAKVALVVAVVGASVVAVLPIASRTVGDWRAPGRPIVAPLPPVTLAVSGRVPSPRAAVPAAPSPRPVAPVATPASPVLATSASERRTAPAPLERAPIEQPASAGADGAAEIELMAEVQAALRSGDASGALSLIDQHERRFPRSILAPERDGARVIARCQTSSPGQARELGRAFLTSYPLSPLGGHVRATCGLGDASR